MDTTIVNSKNKYKKYLAENSIFYNKRTIAKTDLSVFAIVRRLLREFYELRSKLLFIMFMGLIANVMSAVFPWFSKVLIDKILPQKEISILQIACLGLLIIALISVMLGFVQDYISNVLSGNLGFYLKNRIMKHLQILPLYTIQKLKIGGIISSIQQDSEAVSNLFIETIVSPFNALVMFLIAIISLFIINWKVSILCMVFSAIICWIGYFVFNIMRPFQVALREDNSSISSKISEIFGGIQIVRSFCRENRARRIFGNDIGFLWRKILYGNFIGIFVQKSTWLIFYLIQVSIWLFGGYNVIKGTMSIGDIVVFISFIPWIFNPIFNIMALFSQTQKSIACAERIFKLLEERPDTADNKNMISINSINESIEFHNVSFKYPDGIKALNNVSLNIPKGKVTALVGPSGSGKSTIISLLSRFYNVTEGKILIDNINIRDIKVSAYRKLLSLVLQEPYLFDGTIAQNISFGKQDASFEEIERSAKIAHCHEFILKMEKKYETIVGERGTKLSVGQKQRIALARALITDPQILILDEATSNLDSESEGFIQDALKVVLKNRTCIVIAHRLSTIIDADNIIVLDKGEVIEQGSHSELIMKREKYFNMYNKQIEKVKLSLNYWEIT